MKIAENPKQTWLKQFESQPDITILDEILQKSDDPVADFKKLGGKVVIVVPNEWSWNPQFAPFKNPQHKRNYDAEMLAEHLEAAGFTFVMRLLNFGGWSFLTAECVKI